MKKTDWMDAIGKIDPVYVKEAEQWNKAAQKKRTIKHFAAMAACVCVLLIGAVSTFTLFFNRGDKGTETAAGMAEPEQQESQIAESADTSVETAEAAYEEGVTDTEAVTAQADTNEKITMNQVDQLNTVAIDIGYARETVLDAQDLEEHYGVTIFPENLPKELTADAGQEETATSYVDNLVQTLQGSQKVEEAGFTGIIGYNDANEVVADNNTFFYESLDGSKSLEIRVRTTESGEITEFADDNLKTSVVNDNEVTIARLAGDDECYLAIFTKEGVTFTVQTKNLTEAEMLMILRELC